MDPVTGGLLLGGGNALAGLFGARSASRAQSEIAWNQLRQANKNKRQGKWLAKRLYKETVADIGEADAENRGLIGNERNALAGLLGDNRTRNRGVVGAVNRGNMDQLRSDRAATLGGIAGDRDKNIRDFQATGDRNLRTLAGAREQSLGYFRPAQRTGNNALAAFASNLGLGAAPAGYDGLSMSPGAKFRLNEGMGSLQGSAAGRGGLNSGATLAALERFRQGVAADDRDSQMAQLMQLVGVGQNAAGNMANIQGSAANAITGQRNATTGAITGQRNYSTGQTNAALQNYGNAINAQRTATGNANIGINNQYAAGMAGVTGGYTDRMLGNNDRYLANMFNARTQNQGAQQAAMSGSLPYAANALANAGNAAAGGALGVTNALASGVNTGFGAYGYFGGTFGQGQTSPAVQQYGYGATMPGGMVSPPMPRPR